MGSLGWVWVPCSWALHLLAVHHWFNPVRLITQVAIAEIRLIHSCSQLFFATHPHQEHHFPRSSSTFLCTFMWWPDRLLMESSISCSENGDFPKHKTNWSGYQPSSLTEKKNNQNIVWICRHVSKGGPFNCFSESLLVRSLFRTIYSTIFLLLCRKTFSNSCCECEKGNISVPEV